jgi:5-(carboxyamino)imidazole ribonucleotide synthase
MTPPDTTAPEITGAGLETRTPLVAVLGGGQLGRMMALAGIPLGIRFQFLDPSPEAPAGELGRLVVGPLGDARALDDVSANADVVTYEWEGVPGAAAARLTERVAVYPPVDALTVSQDRLHEKQLFERLGIPVATFRPVGDDADLHRSVEEMGLPAVLKTRVGGYDGKGQVLLRHAGDLASAWDAVGRVPSIVEALVPFERELSVIGVRGGGGATRLWPLVDNHHAGGILRRSIAPAPRVGADLRTRADVYMTRLLDDLSYRGVLTLEMFQVGDQLLANELAPRVHNSGHWTIEGSVTSQFENHLRAVLGWPLGSTEARGLSAMVNCIGALPDPTAVLRIEGAHLHRYGKALRPGRKVGHVTVVATERDVLDERLAELAAAMPGDDS